MQPEQQPASPGKALVPLPVESTFGFRGTQAPAAPEDDAESSGLEFKVLLRALRRRWLLALTLAVLLAPTATAAAWFLVPTRHTARTLLYVDATQPTILASYQQSGVQGNYQRTQLALVKSRLVLNAALRDPKVADLTLIRLQPHPVEWLEKQLKADYNLAPEIMSLSLTGDQPEEMITLVNAVRESYLLEVVDKEQNERRGKLERLKKLFADYDNILRDKRRTLRDLAQSVGSGDSQTLAVKHKFALERLAVAQKDLLALQSDLRKAMVEAMAQHAREKVLDKVHIPEAVVQDRIRQDPGIQQDLKEIAKAEQLIEDTKRLSVRGDQEPSLVAFRARLEAAQKALATRKESLRPTILKELREKARDDLEVGVAQAQGKINLLTELEKSVGTDVDKMMKETQVINKGSLDIESLREELAQTEGVAKRVGTQMETLKVELQAPSRVRLLEEASVNADDARKRRMAAAGGAGAGMLLLCLFGVAWFELRAHRISTVDEVKHGAGMRLVGTLPVLSDKDGGGFDDHRRPGRVSPRRRLLLESVDATRTVLLHAARSEKFKTVMVTSAASGEGKTSLASQLSASLARGGFRILLIDGDLRRPVLHRLLGLPQGPGLCELLRGEASIDNVIQHTPLPGLSLISAGRFDGAAHNALARKKSKEIFTGLKKRYDLLVVDSTPVLAVTDALLLAQYADGVLFSILSDVSRLPSVVAACERIEMLGIRILGAVVAGVDSSAYYSHAYYNARYQPEAPDDIIDAAYEVTGRETGRDAGERQAAP